MRLSSMSRMAGERRLRTTVRTKVDAALKCSPVGFSKRCKDRVTANIRSFKQAKHDIAWWLDLVAHILVPEKRCQSLVHETRDVFLVPVAMNNVEAWMSADGTRHRLVVGLAKIVHKFLLRRWPGIDEILVRKHNHLALRDEVGEFV